MIKNAVINMVKKDRIFTLRELAVIFYVSQHQKPENRQTKSIAESLNMSRPAVSRATKALKKRGLMTILPLPDDARTAVISLTRLGQTLVTRIEKGFE